MINYIFELSKYPIPKEERAKLHDISEDFMTYVASWCQDTYGPVREEAIKRFEQTFNGGLIIEEEKILFTEDFREKYFTSKYKKFKKALIELVSGVSYERFITGAIWKDLNNVDNSYSDRYGIYIYYDGSINELSDWLRYEKDSFTYYIGAVIKYHI